MLYPCLAYISHSQGSLLAAVRLGKVRKLGRGGGVVAAPSRMRKSRDRQHGRGEGHQSEQALRLQAGISSFSSRASRLSPSPDSSLLPLAPIEDRASNSLFHWSIQSSIYQTSVYQCSTMCQALWECWASRGEQQACCGSWGRSVSDLTEQLS